MTCSVNICGFSGCLHFLLNIFQDFIEQFPRRTDKFNSWRTKTIFAGIEPIWILQEKTNFA